MSNYFTKFPIISYDGVDARDITRRAILASVSLHNPYLFLPYTVKEGQRPEDIAYTYYGSVGATWIVLLANNIVDPYTQWPMSQDMFHKHLASKYQDQSGFDVDYDIVAWTQNMERADNIVNYYRIADSGLTIKCSPETFPAIIEEGVIVSRSGTEGWTPYRIYDYENDINNNNREILLIENSYFNQIDSEMKRLLLT